MSITARLQRLEKARQGNGERISDLNDEKLEERIQVLTRYMLPEDKAMLAQIVTQTRKRKGRTRTPEEEAQIDAIFNRKQLLEQLVEKRHPVFIQSEPYVGVPTVAELDWMLEISRRIRASGRFYPNAEEKTLIETVLDHGRERFRRMREAQAEGQE